ncbi:MAG: hypothetical protein B9S32_17695 [Verrucomicrobia bacterium Tous-C9LFEB]|nr:MAG: hypothetical protein B9S32_17695 [Verrucomicrobia bacterium Tous-C9LFEB]
MKRIFPLLAVWALALLAACHPTAPAPKATPPPATPPATESISTATAALNLAPAVPTATASLTTSPVELPPTPLLGPAAAQTNAPPALITAPDTSAATNAAPAIVLPPPTIAPAKVTSLRVLAPEGQISDGLRQDLATKMGIEVQIETYSGLEEAAKKLAAPAPGYALALVSYRLIPHLVSEQRLAPLPALPTIRQPAPKYLHHFYDRDNKYSLPYAFSLAGIAVRAADVKAPLSQWNQLFSEANYKVAHLPDDAALESSLLAKAGLRNSSVGSSAAAGDGNSPIQVDSIAHLKKKLAAQPGWRFVLPGEGSIIYMNCAVIPANSPAPEKSAVLLTEFFTPEIVARLAEENYLGVTQLAAYKLLAPASVGDSLIYPPERILDKCTFVRPGYRPIPAPEATPTNR